MWWPSERTLTTHQTPASPPPRTRLLQRFAVSDLEAQAQLDRSGRPRNFDLPDGRTRLDLAADCALLTMLQYRCEVAPNDDSSVLLNCFPVRRWFRRYVLD